MTTEVQFDRKRGRLRITFSGRKVQTRSMGEVIQGGMLGYVTSLTGGVLVQDLFEKPVRIFPEGSEEEATKWLIATLK